MRTSAGASTPSRTWLPRTSRTRTVTASPTRITSPNFRVRTSIARPPMDCRPDARPALAEGQTRSRSSRLVPASCAVAASVAWSAVWACASAALAAATSVSRARESAPWSASVSLLTQVRQLLVQVHARERRALVLQLLEEGLAHRRAVARPGGVLAHLRLAGREVGGEAEAAERGQQALAHAVQAEGGEA